MVFWNVVKLINMFAAWTVELAAVRYCNLEVKRIIRQYIWQKWFIEIYGPLPHIHRHLTVLQSESALVYTNTNSPLFRKRERGKIKFKKLYNTSITIY